MDRCSAISGRYHSSSPCVASHRRVKIFVLKALEHGIRDDGKLVQLKRSQLSFTWVCQRHRQNIRVADGGRPDISLGCRERGATNDNHVQAI